MKKMYISCIAKKLPIFSLSKLFFSFLATAFFCCSFNLAFGQWNSTTLPGTDMTFATSLGFGPDGRLYVSQQDGLIKAFVIKRNGIENGEPDYEIVSEELITLVQDMPNHNDNGALNTDIDTRQVTGILLEGSINNPVLYVSSSDSRIGGPSKGDTNLDTNSGTISRLTWKHEKSPLETDFASLNNEDLWDKVDLVRGLPRSEENHAINGMQIATINDTKYIFLSVGGMTNAGSPSASFNKITEYALAGSIVSIDLTAIEAMPIRGTGVNQYIYDIPTVDDPTRDNITNPDYDASIPGSPETIDENDPFGGNDGLNQAKIVAGGPVQIYAGGFRNTYASVITQDRRMYVTDNGANLGWGGFPENEGTPNVTNNYWSTAEPGTNESSPYTDGRYVNNQDHLELVTGLGTGTIDTYEPGSFYGGHPNPIRANPAGAGLYTHFGQNSDDNGVFRTSTEDPDYPLPADWPPVPVDMAFPEEAYFLIPGVDDNAITTWPNNCNAIAEYTASNLDGAYKGNLIAGSQHASGVLYRLQLNEDGSKKALDVGFATTPQSYILGMACQGDDDIFGGTIWVCSYGLDKQNGKNGNIWIVEPADYDGNEVPPCTGAYDPNLDEDLDGYDNADEIDAGSDPCNGANTPPDADGDLTSDVNDLDDDNDGIEDYLDVFQIGTAEDLVNLPFENELFNDQFGFYGIGMTGIMTNLDPEDDYLNWMYVPSENTAENDIYGGAVGKITVHMTDGDALGELNTQEKALQFGINVDANTAPFTIRSVLEQPFYSLSGEESHGAFIGTGDQDNYIKIVLTASGIAVVKEDAGVATELIEEALAATPTNNVNIFFAINPLNGTVQAKYATDYDEDSEENNVITLGEPVALTGKLLEAIQQIDIALATGIIGTSKGSEQPFKANWDKFTGTFDPITAEGEWYEIASADGSKPTKRHETAFVQVGDHFYLLGGRGNLPIEKYNLTTKTWSKTNTNLNDIHHFQAVAHDGLIYIINAMTGAFPTETPVPNVLIYDPINDKLMTGPEIPEDRRRGSSGVIVYNDKIYVIAGIKNGHTDGWVDFVDEYDPVTGSWTTKTSAPRSRDHFMAVEKDGKIYVAGGRKSDNTTGDFDFSQTIGEVDVYDIANDSWDTLPNNLPTERAGTPTAILGNELFIMGGESGQKEAHPQMEALDLNSGNWRQAKEMNIPRHATQAIVNNGGIFLAAGSGKQGGGPELDTQIAFFLYEQKDPSGSPIANSTLEPSAENIDFGIIEIGETVTETLTFTNSGSDLAIFLESIDLTGDPSITLANVPEGLPKYLAPGAEFTVDVVLNQASDAGKSASLAIQYSSATEPLAVPIVVGEGGEPVPTAPTFLINTGNTTSAQYTDTEGNNWIPDKYNVTGRIFVAPDDLQIEGTEDDVLFRTERYTNRNGQFGYEIPVEEGVYDVSLYFAEIFFTSETDIGKRVFNISIEGGQKILNNYDIIADVGPAHAAIKKFSGVIVNDGNLSIEFINVEDNAKVNAIAIYPNTGDEGITIDSVANQNSKVGDEPQLTILANGGVGNLLFTATSLPPGLSIEPTNGMIQGTVAGDALAGSPYNVTITVKDGKNNTANTQFVWTVTSTVAGDADEDGIADAKDAFAFDPDNGTTTTLPVNITFSNASSVFANGFNGMMLDPSGESDFSSMFTPADVIVNGEKGELVINNVPGGDSYLGTNTQKNGFQFGVKVPTEKFVVHTRLLQPFTQTEPIKYRSMGMYIGTGDQDNYIKIVIGATAENTVRIQTLKEVGGTVGDNDEQGKTSEALKAAESVDLFLEVDPTNLTVSPSIYVNGMPSEIAFEPIAIPQAWLSNVLAVGIISTSTGGSTDDANPFTAKWDMLDVKTPLAVEIDTVIHAQCAGDFGKAALDISGGILPYSQNWGEGVDPDSIAGGTYQVVISDASGYKFFKEVTIEQPNEIILAISQTMAPTCTTNGAVELEVTGTTDFTVEWTSASDDPEDPIITVDPSSLPAGTYFVDVTDNVSQCKAHSSVVLTPIDTVPPTLVGLPEQELVTTCEEVPMPEVTATDDCDGTVEVDSTEASETGRITRTWTATDAAGNTTSFTQVIECPTGLGDDIDSNKLVVYPNPSEDKIVKFEINLNTAATMVIYDMVGRVIMEDKVSSGTTRTFDFSGFKSGSYMVKVFNEDDVIIKRFVLE